MLGNLYLIVSDSIDARGGEDAGGSSCSGACSTLSNGVPWARGLSVSNQFWSSTSCERCGREELLGEMDVAKRAGEGFAYDGEPGAREDGDLLGEYEAVSW
jgi:hypothetical protein